MAPNLRSYSFPPGAAMYSDEPDARTTYKQEPQERTVSSLTFDPLQPPLPTPTLSTFYPHSPRQFGLEPPIQLTSTSTQFSSHTAFLPLPPHQRPAPFTKQEPLPPPIPLESTATLFNQTSFPFTFPPPTPTAADRAPADYTQSTFPAFPTYTASLSAYSSQLPPFEPPLLASPSTHSTASTDSYLATCSSPPSRSTTPDVPSLTSATTHSATIALLPSPTGSETGGDLSSGSPQGGRRPYGRASSSRAAQPATIRRQKHREVDTTRRQKENIAFKKLASLAARRVRVERAREEEEDEESEGGMGGSGGEDERKAKAKLRVLQDSARKMAEMHALIERLVDTNRSLVHQLATATRRPVPAAQQSAALALSILPPTGPQLEAAVVSQSLGSTLFLSSGVGQLVADVASGCVLDVNDRFMSVTRWERPHLLGRILIAPLDLMTAAVVELSTERRRYIHAQSVLVEGSDGQLAPARLDERIALAATVEAVRALYRGEADWVSVVWRLPLRDGRWYDVPCVNYVAGWVESEDGARRPSTMMFLVYSTKITPVE